MFPLYAPPPNVQAAREDSFKHKEAQQPWQDRRMYQESTTRGQTKRDTGDM